MICPMTRESSATTDQSPRGATISQWPKDHTGRLYSYNIDLRPYATAHGEERPGESATSEWTFGQVSQGQSPPDESSLTGRRLTQLACEGTHLVATLLPWSRGPGASRYYKPVKLSDGRTIWPHRFAVDYLDRRASSEGYYTALAQYFCWSPDRSIHESGSLRDIPWTGPRDYHIVQDMILVQHDSEAQAMHYQVIGDDTSESSQYFQAYRPTYTIQRNDCDTEATGCARSYDGGLFTLWSNSLDAVIAEPSPVAYRTITVHHFVPDQSETRYQPSGNDTSCVSH